MLWCHGVVGATCDFFFLIFFLAQLLPTGVSPLGLALLGPLVTFVFLSCPHKLHNVSSFLWPIAQPRACCLHPGESRCLNQVIITGEAQERRLCLRGPKEVFSYVRGINSKEGRGSPSLGFL